MIRTQVYLTEEQARDIRLKARKEQKPEAQVLRELLDAGRRVVAGQLRETLGESMMRVVRVGERFAISGPTDLSQRIDDILYGEEA